MFACAGTVFGVSRLPSPNSIGLGVTGVSPKGIAGVVDEEHSNILSSLRNAPLPDETEQDEAA